MEENSSEGLLQIAFSFIICERLGGYQTFITVMTIFETQILIYLSQTNDNSRRLGSTPYQSTAGPIENISYGALLPSNDKSASYNHADEMFAKWEGDFAQVDVRV